MHKGRLKDNHQLRYNHDMDQNNFLSFIQDRLKKDTLQNLKQNFIDNIKAPIGGVVQSNLSILKSPEMLAQTWDATAGEASRRLQANQIEAQEKPTPDVWAMRKL